MGLQQRHDDAVEAVEEREENTVRRRSRDERNGLEKKGSPTVGRAPKKKLKQKKGRCFELGGVARDQRERCLGRV